MSIEELSRLTVTTVSRRPESLALTPSAVQVISAEDIRRSGATSLPEALRLASNLQVAQVTGNGWAISARGFNSAIANKLLVMIDGRTIYSPLFAGTFWEAHDPPLYDIERIEVISGPGGTLWGANAVNGIINVVTHSAQETQGLLLSAAGGDELKGYGSVRYGGTLGSTAHYRLYGQYVERDGVLLANGADAPNDSDVGQLGFRLDWNATARDVLTLEGAASETQTQAVVTAEPQARSQFLLARWRRQLENWGDLQLQAYFDRADRTNPGSYGDDLRTYDVDLQHGWMAGEDHRVMWGLTWRLIEDDFQNILFAMAPASRSLTRMTGFIQDEITLDDTLRLTVGTKVGNNEYTGTEWQPSVRLAWSFRPRQLLWGAVSRAVRTPSRLERDLANATTPPFTVGSDDFKSETLVAYELGLKLQPAPHTSVSLATYYNEYDDLRTFEPSPGPTGLPFMAANGQEGEGVGAELTVEYRPQARWRLWAGYSYLDLDLRLKPGSRDPTGGATEARDWEQQAFLRSAVDLPGRVELDAALRHITRIDSFGTPAYTSLDLRVGWRPLDSLEVALVGRNLLEDAHAEFGPAGRQQIERSAFVQVTWRP